MKQLDNCHIAILEARGCRSSSWGDVWVHEAFSVSWFWGVTFCGRVEVGDLSGEVVVDGVVRQCGLRNVELRDCVVGDGVLIENVGCVVGYCVGRGAYVGGCGIVVSSCAVGHGLGSDSRSSSATAVSKCGVGTLVAVLNEVGGREVAIYPELTAQVAYVMAMYRHDTALVKALYSFVDQYDAVDAVDAVTSAISGISGDSAFSAFSAFSFLEIGEGCLIRGVGEVRDVRFGAGAVVKDALRLHNGTVGARAVVGCGVVAEDFVIAGGGVVDSGVHIMRCFVGGSARLAHGFTAHDSLFFSNSVCENGEACAVFAGPYTVSMHKATLMIGGMFSFANFGSGSNQSNHLYKLGPLHRGVVERGCKFASDAYIMFPARIGAFSMVMGRHKVHFDSSDFPFSYVIAGGVGAGYDIGQTCVVPGIALTSAGVLRDSDKWPRRDGRGVAADQASDVGFIDCITFSMLNPYTVGRMMRGIEVLSQLLLELCVSTDLRTDCVDELDGQLVVRHGGGAITVRAARRGILYYSRMVDLYFGGLIRCKLGELRALECLNSAGSTGLLCVDSCADSLFELRHISDSSDDLMGGVWIDVAGMVVPKAAFDELCRRVANGEVNSMHEFNAEIHSLHDNFKTFEWQWALPYILAEGTLEQQLERARQADAFFREQLLLDGAKEFSAEVMVGFGIDDTAMVMADFTAVRGEYAEHAYAHLVRDFVF